MPPLPTFRNAEVSLWQSAIDDLLEDLPQAADEAPDSFRDRRLFERAVGDAEVAAVGQAERGPGNDRDPVFPDQPLGDAHRIGSRVHPQTARRVEISPLR